MTTEDLLTQRLFNQELTKTRFQTPAGVVEWFGAMQSQDYPAAKWGLGQRLNIQLMSN